MLKLQLPNDQICTKLSSTRREWKSNGRILCEAHLPAHFFKVLSFKSETFPRKKKISEVNYRTFGLDHSHAWGKLPLAGCEIASCGYIANIFTNPFMKIHSSGYICKYSPANIFIRHIALQICPLDIMPCKYFHKLFKKIRSSGYICKYPC